MFTCFFLVETEFVMSCTSIIEVDYKFCLFTTELAFSIEIRAYPLLKDSTEQISLLLVSSYKLPSPLVNDLKCSIVLHSMSELREVLY